MQENKINLRMVTLSPFGNENMTTGDVGYDTDHDNGRSMAVVVVIFFIVAIIQLVSLFGNTAIIVCIYNYLRLRSEVGSVFIVNLSVTDMLSSIIVMTSSLYAVVVDTRSLSLIWCDIVCCMNYTLIIVSMLTLCFISLDRYVAVVYALRYQVLMTRRIAGGLIAWAWFQGICFGMAPVFMGWIRYDYWEIVCAIQWHVDGSHTLIYVIVAFVLCFFLPGAILSVSYYKVMSVARGHAPHTKIILPEVAGSAVNNNRKPAGNGADGTFVVPSIQIHIDSHEGSTPSAVSDLSNRSQLQDKLEYNIEKTVNGVEEETGGETRKATTSPQQNEDNHSSNSDTSIPNNITGNLNDEMPGCVKMVHSSSITNEGTFVFKTNPQPSMSNQNDDSSYQQTFHSPSLSPPPLSSPPSDNMSFLSPSSQMHFKSIETLTPITNNGSNNNKNNLDTSIDPPQFDDTRHRRVSQESIYSANSSRSAKSTYSKIPRTHQHYSASSKALRSLLIVVLAFFICMTPFSVTKLYKVIVSSPTALPGYVNVVASIFQYCSSAINPLIYGIFRRDFRLAFKSVTKKMWNYTSDIVTNLSYSG